MPGIYSADPKKGLHRPLWAYLGEIHPRRPHYVGLRSINSVTVQAKWVYAAFFCRHFAVCFLTDGPLSRYVEPCNRLMCRRNDACASEEIGPLPTLRCAGHGPVSCNGVCQERACCPGRESNHAAVQDARKPSAQVAIPPVRARFPSILPFTASMTRTRTASSPKKASRAAIAPSKREGSRPLATRVILVFAGRFRQSPLPSPRF